MNSQGDLVVDERGVVRCAWGASTADYARYHDEEWGREVHGERALFERLTLEAFQSGLSWLTILRKRERFRLAFADFDVETVAGFDSTDVARLLADSSIVRNRAKISATLVNARAALSLRDAVEGGLDALIWSYRPTGVCLAPRALQEVPARTSESTALAKRLKTHGFCFLGPTTVYAAMQACGLVNDHLLRCSAREVAAKADTGSVSARGSAG